MPRRGRLLIAGSCALATVLAGAPAARAQTPELDEARTLFAGALQQQEAGHPDVALAQFRRVARVRDTAQVEYRIGSCLEALGRRRDAVLAYDRATRLGRGDEQAADVVGAANARIADLGRSMGTLEVAVQGVGAARAELTVDGEVLSPEERKAPLLLEPGAHEVTVGAPGARPAVTRVLVAAGARAGVTVVLAPATPPPRPAETWGARRVGGVVTVGAGVAALAGMGVALWVRHDRIAQVESDCPGNVCPSSLRPEVESARSDAQTLGPAAAILGGVGAAALVAGVLLIEWPSHDHAGPSAWVAPSPTGLTAGGTF